MKVWYRRVEKHRMQSVGPTASHRSSRSRGTQVIFYLPHSLSLYFSFCLSMTMCIQGGWKVGTTNTGSSAPWRCPPPPRTFNLFWEFGAMKNFSDTEHQKQGCHYHHRRINHLCPGRGEITLSPVFISVSASVFSHAPCCVSVTLRSPSCQRKRDR